jgi:hypothetical protein
MDGAGGAFFGLIQGALVALLLGWLGLWLEAAERVGAEVPVSPPPGSFTAKLSGGIAETGVELFMGSSDPSARVAARFAADPAESVERVQSLTENPRIVALRKDPAFWSDVRQGSLDAALNRGSFLGIAHDATLRQELADLGLVDEEAATDPRLFRNQVRGTLSDVGERIRGLEDGPELRSIAEDPNLQEALQRGDTVSLLRDPRVQELIGRVLAPEQPPSTSGGRTL